MTTHPREQQPPQLVRVLQVLRVQAQLVHQRLTPALLQLVLPLRVPHSHQPAPPALLVSPLVLLSHLPQVPPHNLHQLHLALLVLQHRNLLPHLTLPRVPLLRSRQRPAHPLLQVLVRVPRNLLVRVFPVPAPQLQHLLRL